MPPHIEIDSHHDDWHQPSARQPPLMAGDNEPSPLFRDHESLKVSPISRLDRRQSNPDFPTAGKEMLLKEDPIKQAVAPVISVITAIIGPESAYVKAPSSSSRPPATKGSTTTSTTAAVGAAQQKQPPTKKSPNPNNKGKMETKPILLRASRYVSKKGWKVVKSLPNKLVSTVGSMKVPCHHRNVV